MTLAIYIPPKLLSVHTAAKELSVSFPSLPSNLDLAAAKSIYNAWMETAVIDNHGEVWLLARRLGEILRTSKGNARYISDSIERQYRSQGAEGTYFHYAEVNRRLSLIITAAGSTRREKYAEFSESIGMAIRSSDRAKLLRAEFYAAVDAGKKKLKSQRMKQLGIQFDELTGVRLLPTCQFSHIKSCSLFPEVSLQQWNGLIVNRAIHKIITSAEINEEDALHDLCVKQGWQTNWYIPYTERYQEYMADLN
jgi:hypothetical protein